MTIDDPTLLAEATAPFLEYERASMTDDSPAMDLPFNDAPTTNHHGVGEVLNGIAEIRAFRKGRGGSPQRKPGKVTITAHGDGFATADAEFFRENSDRRGQQTRSWVKFPDGWKIDSAHVGMEGSTS